MKKIICILDVDEVYAKKFCNVSTKMYNQEYIFLYFNDMKSLIEYSKENIVCSVIVAEDFINEIEDIKTSFYYVLTDVNNKNFKEGKFTYLYKYQNINKLLEIIKTDIEAFNDAKNKKNSNSKLITFYSPYTDKSQISFAKKIATVLSKKHKTLYIDLSEYDNYKSNIGFSNIIYLYKEGSLSIDGIKHEIVIEKELDVLYSVSYPEDFSVINSVDLGNILNYIMKLNYDYILVNTDNSYVKNQYIILDSYKTIFYRYDEEENKKIDILKSYLSSQCILDINKIINYKIEIGKRNMTTSFIKDYIYDKE